MVSPTVVWVLVLLFSIRSVLAHTLGKRFLGYCCQICVRAGIESDETSEHHLSVLFSLLQFDDADADSDADACTTTS